MAASFSRPDPSSPASVAEAGFSTARRGYHQGEVRALLASVAAELGRLQERQRQLEAELHTARNSMPSFVELDDETIASRLGEETLRVLHTARESASEIKIRAEENAARILRDANDEANRIRQETEVETARRRYDASADAEAEVALAKQQGREMVNEARAYRERVLADLERRTTLARHQIEELLHGRDRLLQVFERARLVAVDVTSDLQSIDTPAELVNLSHVTGPVPLMVPNEGGDRRHSEAPPGGHDRPSAGAPDPAGPSDPPTAPADGDPTELLDIIDANADAVPGAAEEPHDIEVGADLDTDTDTLDDADHADDLEATDAAPAAPQRDANVVSLFRGRAVPMPADAGGDPDEGEIADAGEQPGDEDEHKDVDGIFARLRDETGSGPGPADTDAPAGSDAPAGGDAPESTEPLPEPTAFSRRDEAIVPLIVQGARKVKRVLADEQNGVLDTLRGATPVRSIGDLLPEVAEHVAVYVEALSDELVAAAAAGAGELGINDTKTLRRRLAKTGALDAAHDLLRSDLLRPLRDRLDRAISDGSGDNEDITKRVRAVYREWKTQHIDDQLDDVFRFAHGGGLAVSIEPGSPLVWAIDSGHAACPDCEDNSLAGSVAAGEAFPTGHVSAPAHPGCRCLTLPVSQ